MRLGFWSANSGRRCNESLSSLGYREKEISETESEVVLIIKGLTDRWRRLDLLDFFGVFLIIKAVSKEVPKVTQGSL